MTLFEKIGIIISVAAIIVIGFLIVFSRNGILDYRELKLKEKQIAVQTEQVQRENKKIESEVKKLKTDVEYIKHVAKHEYEMTEKDEIIFKDDSQK